MWCTVHNNILPRKIMIFPYVIISNCPYHFIPIAVELLWKAQSTKKYTHAIEFDCTVSEYAQAQHKMKKGKQYEMKKSSSMCAYVCLWQNSSSSSIIKHHLIRLNYLETFLPPQKSSVCGWFDYICLRLTTITLRSVSQSLAFFCALYIFIYFWCECVIPTISLRER